MKPPESENPGGNRGVSTTNSEPSLNPFRPDVKDQRAVFRRLIYDKRLSHGAFHLWHYLYDRRNASGKTWPEQRAIAKDLECKTSSLKGWTVELVNAGYLATEKKGQNHHLEYTILFGDGNGVMPEWATRGKAQKGDAKAVSCIPKGNGALPERATPGVSQMGDGSNNTEVITKSEGSTVPIFEPVKRNLYRREYEGMIADAKAEIERAKCNRDLTEKGPQSYNLQLTELGRGIVKAWRNRIAEIQRVMNGQL